MSRTASFVELLRASGFASIREFSARTGVPRSTLHYWLRTGRTPSPGALGRVASMLGVSPRMIALALGVA